MTSWITICDTCKREGWTAESQPLTDGEVFADLIEARAAAAGVKWAISSLEPPACSIARPIRKPKA
jgi:hypothetical protein